MKYDPIELMKLNITEDGIRLQRDMILRFRSEYNEKKFVFIIGGKYLPFVIDIMDDVYFTCEPISDTYVQITIAPN